MEKEFRSVALVINFHCRAPFDLIRANETVLISNEIHAVHVQQTGKWKKVWAQSKYTQ